MLLSVVLLWEMHNYDQYIIHHLCQTMSNTIVEYFLILVMQSVRNARDLYTLLDSAQQNYTSMNPYTKYTLL